MIHRIARSALAIAALAGAPVLPAVAHADKPAAAGAARSFDKQPAKGAKAVCPVSGEDFVVRDDTKFTTHKGRTYAFCCPKCQPAFEKNPDKYADKK